MTVVFTEILDCCFERLLELEEMSMHKFMNVTVTNFEAVMLRWAM